MPQPTENEIGKLLSRILESPEFRESPRYQELLKYLIDKSAKSQTLKETEIAIDVFGKDAKFDPSADPLIRSYISNLRKKLEHYYLTTEDELTHKLEIPRGHYLVKYSEAGATPKEKSKIPIPYLALGGVILILLIYIFVREFSGGSPVIKESSSPLNPVWTEFVGRSAYPTLIILGDYLVLSEKGMKKGRTFLREPWINSSGDLTDSLKSNPAKYGKYEVADVAFLGPGASLGITQIYKAIGEAAQNATVKLSSQLKWDDLDEHNIIFIGSLKTLYQLDTLFSRSGINYSLSPNILTIPAQGNKPAQNLEFDWSAGNYQKDYSIVLKYRGLKDNSIVFLTGFSEVGIMDAIKAATDKNLTGRIAEFYKKDFSTSPFLFELVSESEGVKYTVFRSQIKYFRTL